jgi:hypothetical protein
MVGEYRELERSGVMTPRQSETFDPVRMLAVYQPGPGGRSTFCCGHIHPRGPVGYEAFDRNTRSLGLFADQKNAGDAISRADNETKEKKE